MRYSMVYVELQYLGAYILETERCRMPSRKRISSVLPDVSYGKSQEKGQGVLSQLLLSAWCPYLLLERWEPILDNPWSLATSGRHGFSLQEARPTALFHGGRERHNILNLRVMRSLKLSNTRAIAYLASTCWWLWAWRLTLRAGFLSV